jgi:hypothetical protein
MVWNSKKLPTWTTLTEEYLTVLIMGILLTMKYHFIQRMYLLQQEDKCGYSIVEHLHILAEIIGIVTHSSGI